MRTTIIKLLSISIVVSYSLIQLAVSFVPEDVRKQWWSNLENFYKKVANPPPQQPSPVSKICTSDDMMNIPEVTFEMGNKGDQSDKYSVHLKGFTISCYPVTTEQYNSYLLQQTGKIRPANGTEKCSNCPITNISWREATAYTTWLSKQTNKPYCLPTEAQWEYAANSFEPQKIGEWTCSQYIDKYDSKEQECLPTEETKKLKIAVRGVGLSDKAYLTQRGRCFIDGDSCQTRNIGFRVVNSEDTCPKTTKLEENK